MNNPLSHAKAARRCVEPSWSEARAEAVRLNWSRLTKRRARRRNATLVGLAALAVLGAVEAGSRSRTPASRVARPVTVAAPPTSPNSVPPLVGAPAAPLSPPRSAVAIRAAHRFKEVSVEPLRSGTLLEPLADEEGMVLRTGGARFHLRGVRSYRVEVAPFMIRFVGSEFSTELSNESIRVAVDDGHAEIVGNGSHVSLRNGGVIILPRGVEARAQPGPNAVEQDAEQLLANADGARNDHRPMDAVESLGRIVLRYPKHPLAPLAAFELGHILLEELGRPADAARAFASARALDPTGSVAEDALARQIQAEARAGHAMEARHLAAEYQRRYPYGRRLESVRRWGELE